MRIEFDHGCWQEINEHARLVVTHFGDGARLVAVAAADPESVARACALGYTGSDREAVWAMTLEHDRLHMELAQAEGYVWSLTLHAAAVGEVVPPSVSDQEERRVLWVQAALNRARVLPYLRDELVRAFESVADGWLADLGDIHDAWNPGDLADAVLKIARPSAVLRIHRL